LSSAAATAASETESKRHISISIDGETDRLIRNIADLSFGGNLSKAVEGLIRLHGGQEIERHGEQPPAEVFEVVKWKSPRLSRDLASYIAGMVRAGALQADAFKVAGVTVRQSKAWITRGRNDLAHDRQSLHADLVMALDQAHAERKLSHVMRIEKAADWRASAWILSRQYADEYAERKRVDNTHAHALMPMIDWERLNVTQTRQLVELLRIASPQDDTAQLSRMQRPALELLPPDIIDGEWSEAPAIEASAVEKPET
jgi:hypothetical protein